MKEKCKDCKWMDVFEEFCLLGRNPKKCNSFKARRGDEEFAERLIDAHTNGVVDEEKIRERKQSKEEKPKES